MIIEYFILGLSLVLLAVTASNVLWWPRLGGRAGARPLQVSVLIPARNEEQNLPACLDSVLKQGSEVREVLVYDDHSTDKTGEVIGSYAAADSRVRQIRAAPLPGGWCGKNFACARLAAEARGEWLLFLDADARLEKDAVARMLGEAERRELTLLSCWPGLRMFTFAERALMPMLNFVVFSLFPGALSVLKGDGFRRDPKLGLAHGACLLFHRRSYEEFGGHGVVKDQIFEDTRLAQLWRQGGRAGACLDGQGVVGLRMYNSLGEIWRGFQKNFYPAFRRDASFWAFIALHALVFFYPFVAVLLSRSRAAVAAVAAVVAVRALLALRFGHPWASVVLHPVGEAVLLALGLSSWLRCKTGRGVEWKGREYLKPAGH
jgi:glycosyltransferase involved in cell wall biosynthesis